MPVLWTYKPEKWLLSLLRAYKPVRSKRVTLEKQPGTVNLRGGPLVMVLEKYQCISLGEAGRSGLQRFEKFKVIEDTLW